MAEFDGITAAAAQAILDQCIVSGEVNVAGHIIFTRFDGSTIDGGDFSGTVTPIVETAVDEAFVEVQESIPAAVAGTNYELGNVSGAVSFTDKTADQMVNALFELTATGNITINSATAFPAGMRPNTQFALRITQDAIGSRTLTLTGFKRSQGVLTLTTTANAIDLLVFIYDGTNWYAGMMGADLK